MRKHVDLDDKNTVVNLDGNKGNTRQAIATNVDDEDKGVAKCDTPSGTQEMTIINESGLYSLVLSSKLPGAKKFKRWVTSEVLPAIRKNGGYISGQNDMTPKVHFDHKCAWDRHHNKAKSPDRANGT